MKKFKIDVSLFKTTVFVWYCSATQATKLYSKTTYFKDDPDIKFEGHGKTLYIPLVAPIVWVNDSIGFVEEIATLTHEFTHVVNGILLHKGIPLNEDTDEVYAYFLEYLIRESLKKIVKETK